MFALLSGVAFRGMTSTGFFVAAALVTFAAIAVSTAGRAGTALKDQ